MSKYAFLLPSYKGSYFKDALNSISAQSYKDFSVIISDDCSPEDLLSIAAPFLDDRRFTYRRNETNVGGRCLVDHWNLLLNCTDADYIIMACDDDLYEKDFLVEIDKLVNKYPNVDLIRARSQRISSDGLIEKDPCSDEYITQLEFLCDSYVRGHIHCIGNYVFRRAALIEKGGFCDFPLAWYSDDHAAIISSIGGVAVTNRVLFSIRNSDINISSECNRSPEASARKIHASMQFYEWMLTDVMNNMVVKTVYEKKLYWKVTNGLRNYIYNLIKQYINDIDYQEYIKVHDFLYEHHFISDKKTKLSLANDWYKIHRSLRAIIHG